MMRRIVIVLLALVASLEVVGRAQSPTPTSAPLQPAVTFKADVNFVELHAVITDQRGNVIKDLAKDDFEVFEDGKPQTPSVCSLVGLPIERPLASYGTPPVEPDVRSIARSFEGRLYVLVLDDLHTSALRSQLVRDAAKRFIQQDVGEPVHLPRSAV